MGEVLKNPPMETGVYILVKKRNDESLKIAVNFKKN